MDETSGEFRVAVMNLWPASLMHNVYPNMSEEQRISIGFNIVLEWDNRYLE